MRPATPLICEFIDEHREKFGVVPICRALAVHGVQIAPRTYWAHRTADPPRDLAQRQRDDAARKGQLGRQKISTAS